MDSPKRVNVAVIGAGGVGAHFLTQLLTLQKTYPNISLIAITRSSKSIAAVPPTSSLNIPAWEHDLSTSTQPALSIPHLLDLLSQFPGAHVLIDNTSDQAIANAYPSILHRGTSIVTPNKKAFSGPLNFWDAIQKATTQTWPPGALCYHESSVGAGLPILSTLADLLATGDRVRKIEGVFSGTMSFLFNNFAPVEGKGGKWSEEVRKAKEAGFTEPDPRDDLNGMDVARKLVILARIAGVRVEGTSAFPVQRLIPTELEAVESAEEFMQRLPEFDAHTEEIKAEAEREGKVVRFVGSIDVGNGALKVGLERFERGHPIAALKGSDNVVSFYTERYGQNPLIVQGAGAGGAVTAMGVAADLVRVVQRLS
ncbi:hypothetical protein MMC21_005256 [Puttea exsequens]|nr:hypothetical protein [Puttea exsequens]